MKHLNSAQNIRHLTGGCDHYSRMVHCEHQLRRSHENFCPLNRNVDIVCVRKKQHMCVSWAIFWTWFKIMHLRNNLFYYMYYYYQYLPVKKYDWTNSNQENFLSKDLVPEDMCRVRMAVNAVGMHLIHVSFTFMLPSEPKHLSLSFLKFPTAIGMPVTEHRVIT